MLISFEVTLLLCVGQFVIGCKHCVRYRSFEGCVACELCPVRCSCYREGVIVEALLVALISGSTVSMVDSMWLLGTGMD